MDNGASIRYKIWDAMMWIRCPSKFGPRGTNFLGNLAPSSEIWPPSIWYM